MITIEREKKNDGKSERKRESKNDGERERKLRIKGKDNDKYKQIGKYIERMRERVRER